MKTWMCALMLALSTGASAQNPIISGQYSADPTARVFNGKVYLYPSHDIPSPIEKLKEWFCMADYHVFSSTNLTEWQDHGVIVSQDKVPWVQDGSYTMWAPDCVEKDGKYYFYFPAAPKGEEKGFGIGVAVADQPEGPFMPMWKPIEGVHGIDPCVLIDKDGQAYIYWAGAGLHMAKLKPNMTELASEPKLVDLPEGIRYIGNEAFAYCVSLTTFIVRAETPPELGKDVFSHIDISKCTLIVPADCSTKYKDYDIWNQFGTIREIGQEEDINRVKTNY